LLIRSVRRAEQLHMRKFSLIAILSITGLFAGCGGDDSSSEPSPSGGGASGGGNLVEIGMEGSQYMPATVDVPVGATVKWTNSDTPAHTVDYVDGPGEKFSSGTMNPGDVFEQKFAAAGTVNYICDIHPFQKGVLNVK